MVVFPNPELGRTGDNAEYKDYFCIIIIIPAVNIGVQWNLSIMDTLRTEKQFVIQRFPLFRGYFIDIAIYLNP